MDRTLTTSDDAVGGGGGGDAFLHQYQPSDLRIASEFLTTWLPFLSRDLCPDCSLSLSNRIRSLSPATGTAPEKSDEGEDTNSLGSWKDADEGGSSASRPARPRMSWADMAAQEDELAAPGDEEEEMEADEGESSASRPARPRMSWADMAAQEDELAAPGDEEEEMGADREGEVQTLSPAGTGPVRAQEKPNLSRDQREYLRFMNVKRKKDFITLERVKGKLVNVLAGLELHKGIFSAAEQKRIVDYVYQLQEMGRRGELRERTFTAPQKWMKGKGRVTIQFGCCYNYATDKNGNPPGILHSETVDPIPSLFKVIIRRLIRWHVLPPSCVPDSCIVNIYDEGDCIPPHIDNHDFLRPFCTVSFLSECNIVFGTNLKVVGPGEFDGPVAIPLPVGSVLVLNGNSADVAKHCVPSVPTKRISITFRRMGENKRPASFVPEPDLQDIQPLSYESINTKNRPSPMSEDRMRKKVDEKEGGKEARPFLDRGYHLEPRYSNRGRRGSGYRPRIKVNMNS